MALAPKFQARLRQLADYLDTVPKSNFNIHHWVSGRISTTGCSDPKLRQTVLLDRLREHTCGTAACAMGYAPIVFPEYFELRCDSSHNGWPIPPYPALTARGLEEHPLRDGGADNPIACAAAFFGVSWYTAESLFMAGSYLSAYRTDVVLPGEVAKRLRLVAEHGLITETRCSYQLITAVCGRWCQRTTFEDGFVFEDDDAT